MPSCASSTAIERSIGCWQPQGRAENKKAGCESSAAGPVNVRSFAQHPLAVLDLDDDAGAVVHASVVGRAHVENAIAPGDVLGVFERVAQRRAKFLRARLRLFQSLGYRPL